MRTAQDIINEYRERGYDVLRLRAIASLRPEPMCSQMLALIDAMEQAEQAQQTEQAENIGLNEDLDAHEIDALASMVDTCPEETMKHTFEGEDATASVDTDMSENIEQQDHLFVGPILSAIDSEGELPTDDASLTGVNIAIDMEADVISSLRVQFQEAMEAVAAADRPSDTEESVHLNENAVAEENHATGIDTTMIHAMPHDAHCLAYHAAVMIKTTPLFTQSSDVETDLAAFFGPLEENAQQDGMLNETVADDVMEADAILSDATSSHETDVLAEMLPQLDTLLAQVTEEDAVLATEYKITPQETMSFEDEVALDEISDLLEASENVALFVPHVGEMVLSDTADVDAMANGIFEDIMVQDAAAEMPLVENTLSVEEVIAEEVVAEEVVAEEVVAEEVVAEEVVSEEVVAEEVVAEEVVAEEVVAEDVAADEANYASNTATRILTQDILDQVSHATEHFEREMAAPVISDMEAVCSLPEINDLMADDDINEPSVVDDQEAQVLAFLRDMASSHEHAEDEVAIDPPSEELFRIVSHEEEIDMAADADMQEDAEERSHIIRLAEHMPFAELANLPVDDEDAPAAGLLDVDTAFLNALEFSGEEQTAFDEEWSAWDEGPISFPRSVKAQHMAVCHALEPIVITADSSVTEEKPAAALQQTASAQAKTTTSKKSVAKVTDEACQQGVLLSQEVVREESMQAKALAQLRNEVAELEKSLDELERFRKDEEVKVAQLSQLLREKSQAILLQQEELESSRNDIAAREAKMMEFRTIEKRFDALSRDYTALQINFEATERERNILRHETVADLQEQQLVLVDMLEVENRKLLQTSERLRKTRNRAIGAWTCATAAMLMLVAMPLMGRMSSSVHSTSPATLVADGGTMLSDGSDMVAMLRTEKDALHEALQNAKTDFSEREGELLRQISDQRAMLEKSRADLAALTNRTMPQHQRNTLIPGGDSSMARVTPAHPGQPGSTTSPAAQVIKHRVKSGDTLARIAEKYIGSSDPSTIKKLANQNGMSDPNRLRLNQVITVSMGESQY